VTTGCIEATILAATGAVLRLPERHLEPPETEDQIASGGTVRRKGFR
jgi:hypothetical protein